MDGHILNAITLLERLTELRKPVCSLDYWFTTKDIKRYVQQPDEELHKVKSQTKELLIRNLGPIIVALGGVLASNLRALQISLF